jgi:hypothetical protein
MARGVRALIITHAVIRCGPIRGSRVPGRRL